MTYAVRDTKIDDKEIHLGDIMGIGDAGILAVGKEIRETALAMMEEMVDADSEIIGIYYGEDVSEEDANALGELLAEKYPDAEVEVHYGAAPSVFGRLGFLKGRKACCYPTFEEKLEGAEVVQDPVSADGHIITSRGMGTAIPFALKLTALLCGEEKAVEIGRSIIYHD